MNVQLYGFYRLRKKQTLKYVIDSPAIGPTYSQNNIEEFRFCVTLMDKKKFNFLLHILSSFSIQERHMYA